MKHDKLTIVAIYGHNNGVSAIPSIVKSMKELPGSHGLLLSIEKPDNLPDNIKWKHIYHNNYKRYSIFMMHSLYAFIETDFCLVVQDDGWVLNGKNFKPEYYDYDFIGSPSHCAVLLNTKSEITNVYLNFNWSKPEVFADPNLIVVQNGGFSLRSKRFLEACNKHGLTHYGVDSIPIKADDIEKPWHAIWNEDVHLTALFKNRLESEGYKIAPLEVAKTFSVEYLDPNIHANLKETLDTILGHHGPTRKLVDNNTIHVYMNSVSAGNEHHFFNFLVDLGYKVKVVEIKGK